jgi:hypothetical protein
MTDQELAAIVAVLKDSLPDESGRTQLGLLLYHELRKQRDQLRAIIHTLDFPNFLKRFGLDHSETIVETLIGQP